MHQVPPFLVPATCVSFLVGDRIGVLGSRVQSPDATATQELSQAWWGGRGEGGGENRAGASLYPPLPESSGGNGSK